MPSLPLYSIYGLRVQTELPLGPLPLVDGEPDVIVRYGPARVLALRAPRPGCFEVRPDHVFLGTTDGGVVVARQGREVIVDAQRGLCVDALVSLVLGQGLAAILHQRRVLTLHASAVALEGEVLAFLGDQGAGKSTVASALLQRGGTFVTDDVLAIREVEGEASRVHSGYPFLKVTEATATALSGGVTDLDPAWSAVTKWKLMTSTTSDSWGLRAIYVLQRGEEVQGVRLNGVEAFAEVARHSFAGALAFPTGCSEEYLHKYVNLTRSVPVFRFTVPNSLDRLTEVAECLSIHSPTLADPAQLLPG